MSDLRTQLSRHLEAAYELADRESSQGCLHFLNHVVINTIPPRPFRVVAEPWQWALASRVIPAIEFAAQVRESYDGPTRFEFVLPKGHDKTSFIGRILNWVMAYNRSSSFQAYAAAKDKEQAGRLARAMITEATLNPWLDRRIEFKNWRVLGQNNSQLDILSTDSSGTAGILPDLVVIDELSQWEDEEFFGQLLAGLAKRSDVSGNTRCVLIVITNAGLKGSWQYRALQEARGSLWPKGKWYIYEAPVRTRLASWMSEEDINELRKFLPDHEARMLYDNEWVDPSEVSGLCTREQAQACENVGVLLGLRHQTEGKQDRTYVAAIDYGPVKDRTVMVVGHKEKDIIVIDRMDVLQGSRENHVPIERVETWIDEVSRKFPLGKLVLDMYQMESVWQKYRHLVPIERFEARGGRGNFELACVMRSLLVNRQLAWYPDCGRIEHKGKPHTLVDEIAEIVLKPMSYGVRIDHRTSGHDDRVVATAMMAVQVLKMEQRRNLWLGEKDLWF